MRSSVGAAEKCSGFFLTKDIELYSEHLPVLAEW